MTVNKIRQLPILTQTITYIPLRYFNSSLQNIDLVAQEYLSKCREINPIQTVSIATNADGSCLYHSILALMPSLDVTPIELRTRTIVELVTNFEEYTDNLLQSVGPLQERWKDICKSSTYSDLYELVALCNVLRCNIRSLYPRIDYHSYFDIYNNTFRSNLPADNGITLLWCHTKTESIARTYTGGNWLPNHFVPVAILLPDISLSQSNHQLSTSRNLVYSNADDRNATNSNVSSTEDSIMLSGELDMETINNVNINTNSMITTATTKTSKRIYNDAARKRISRSLETTSQTTLRLSKQRDRTRINRAKQTEEQVKVRLAKKSNYKKLQQLTRLELKQNARVKDGGKTNSSSWPQVVPYDYKCQCLQNFTNCMSKSKLIESSCAICNIRAFSRNMIPVSINELKNKSFLYTHVDILTSIPGHENLLIDDVYTMETNPSDIDYSNLHSEVSNGPNQTFSFHENILLYRKGLSNNNTHDNECLCMLCKDCYTAYTKAQIPKFSTANKMWIGDIPDELKDLTVVEEKLISIYRHNTCIIKLQSPYHSSSTAQSALKGNIITFPQNVPNIASTLPLDMSTLCDTIKIVFIGSHKPSRDQIKKILKVRKIKILNALQWLQKHNILYKNVSINHDNVNDLPDNDIPEPLWITREEHVNNNEVVNEREGYVSDPLIDATQHGEKVDPNIIPMHISGILDVQGTSITSEDINCYLLEKLHIDSTKSSATSTDKYSTGDDVVYMIPHGSKPTNEYLNPHLLPGLYPTLFPYGVGGLDDSSRGVKVSIKDHMYYLLNYDDKRFEKHHSFMFVVFNMMQRREACLQARLLISKPFFSQEAQTINTITTDELQKVLTQTANGRHSFQYNSRINTLLKNIRCIGGHVMGSVQKRSSLKTLIHGLIFNHGLFSIFLTINPADIHHPLTMHFAGIDFDIDNILPEDLPPTYKRAEIVASHPVATAKFFNHLISSILTTLIEGGPNGGVLGKIKAYFGTVESQGRGSLHLHMVIWLDHDLTPVCMKNNVQDEAFKERLISYLEDIIKEDLDLFRESNDTGLNESDVREINTTNVLAACRLTPKPSTKNFDQIFREDAGELAEQNNKHRHTRTCYKYGEKCRSHMPRELIAKSEINSVTGTISMKRNHKWINNYNEWIISACRSNMDIKFVWSGCDAKALSYYITDYITKSNVSFHDNLALLVKVRKDFDEKRSNPPDNNNIHERSRRLLLKMHNTLASQQELSGVQV
ncbi:unnamed protein product, partial [Adineta steineri]